MCFSAPYLLHWRLAYLGGFPDKVHSSETSDRRAPRVSNSRSAVVRSAPTPSASCCVERKPFGKRLSFSMFFRRARCRRSCNHVEQAFTVPSIASTIKDIRCSRCLRITWADISTSHSLWRSGVSRRGSAVYPSGREGLERAAGIEPASIAWKAIALPLCYARENKQNQSLTFSLDKDVERRATGRFTRAVSNAPIDSGFPRQCEELTKRWDRPEFGCEPGPACGRGPPSRQPGHTPAVPYKNGTRGRSGVLAIVPPIFLDEENRDGDGNRAEISRRQ